LNIRFKEEFLDHQIFLASTPDGRGVNEEKLLSTTGLSEFKRRALYAGYPENTMFYSWRRGAATNFDRIKGDRAATRAFMGHEASGQVFEQAYNNTNSHVDVLGIAPHEDQ
jgi:hypothetical protein